MQAAVRPYFTTGVAIVGASLIVASTVSPVPDIQLPDVHLPAVPAAAVDLAAAINPIEVYARVFQDALTNTGTLFANTVPGQVLTAIITNQLDSVATLADALGVVVGGIGSALTTEVPQLLQAAVAQLAAGDVSGAVNSLLLIPVAVVVPATALLPALETIITKPLQNLINVVQAFTDPEVLLETELLLSGFIAPLISTPAAIAVAIQNVVDAVVSFDPLAIVGAILAAPAVIIDGLLNGGYGPDLGPLVGSPLPVKAGGLLSSPELVEGDDGVFFLNTGGPIAALQGVLRTIAEAIAPPDTAAVQVAQSEVTTIPSATATTLTLTSGVDPEVAPLKTAAPADTADVDAADVDAADVDAADVDAADVDAADVDAADVDAEAHDAAADAVADTTKETESGDTTSDSTPKSDTTKASDDKEPTVKDVDVTTGNKVEPQTATGSDASKSGDAVSHEATTEQAGTATDATSDSGAEKGADSGSEGSSS